MQKKNRSIAEKSFAVGTLAETIEALGPYVNPFVQHLLPAISNMLKEENDEVRSNAVFGLGVLAASGAETAMMYP